MDKKCETRQNTIRLQDPSADSEFDLSDIGLQPKQLEKYTKEQLIRLITTNKEKLVIKKQTYSKKNKQIDFKKYPLTRIALKFSYIGTNYAGLVVQSNVPKTVE